MPMHSVSVVPEDTEKEALLHRLGLLAKLRPPPERSASQRGPRLPVWPAARRSVRRGRSAKTGHGESRRRTSLL